MPRIYTAVEGDLDTRLFNYMKSLPISVQRNKVMTKALDFFLKSEGF